MKYKKLVSGYTRTVLFDMTTPGTRITGSQTQKDH